MTKFKKNWTNSIDNLNQAEKDIKDLQDFTDDDLSDLIAKVNYLYRLAGGN